MSNAPTSPADHSTQSDGVLPAYVHIRPNGVYIEVSPPPPQEILQLFVDRLFTNDAYFKGLDYAVFLDLLYGAKPATVKNGAAHEVRVASEIVTFAPHRKDLYRGVKIIRNGERAEYVFEPMFTEVIFEEPVYGPTGDDGIAPIVEFTKKTEARPTKLEFGEFVAEMWCKGVRFGIAADAVRAIIQSNTPTRMEIASQREPTASKDAQLVEENSNLRQDRSPLILSSGRAVLSTAKNHFPQVAKNAPLLRKIPRALGDPGYQVTGAVIEPRLPLDIDLQALSGDGTRIDHSAQGDLIVADMDGFLRFDEKANKVAVTATIENRSGISAKSTGDIKLDVNEFIEYGEVQEGRVVQGKHLTFHSAVYGAILSTGGNIRIEDNLSSGLATSVGGNITVSGRAYNSTLEAWDGHISIKFAESCTILGKSVSVERAVNCEIVADVLQLDLAEGCAIAGKNVRITSTQTRKGRETIVNMLLPDCSGLESQIVTAKENIEKIDAILSGHADEMAAARSDSKQAKLIELGDKIRDGLIQLTPQQQTEWQKVFAQFPTAIKDTLVLMGKRKTLVSEIAGLSQQIKASYAQQRCNIEEVLDDTVVQTLHAQLGIGAFRNLPKQELKSRLLHVGVPKKRIFSGSHGRFEWQSRIPELPDTAS